MRETRLAGQSAVEESMARLQVDLEEEEAAVDEGGWLVEGRGEGLGGGGWVAKGLSIGGLQLLVVKLEGVGALRGGVLVLRGVCEREVLVCGAVYTACKVALPLAAAAV